MHDTPPGRPHGPEPDAGPDDALVGELRELMERAAAGLAPLPDLTQEAVRLGRRRRVRARAAVVGAVTGVLAIGGLGTAVLGGALTGGGGLNDPASPAVAPVSSPAVPPTTVAPSPAPSASTTPPTPTSMPSETATSEATKRRALKAAALTQVLGEWIGTVSPLEPYTTSGADDVDLFAGQLDGHVFPVTFLVVPGADALFDCAEIAGSGGACRTALLPGGIEARVYVAGGDQWGGESISVTYRYANSTVELNIAPDTAGKVSPPVTADQVVAAAGSSVLLAQVKHEAELQANNTAEANDTSGTSETGGPRDE